MENRTYKTVEGETVDSIAARELGSEAAVDALFSLNPHISEYDDTLPYGIEILLPQIYEKKAMGEVHLWD